MSRSDSRILLIISDTSIVRQTVGSHLIFEPTLREVEHLTEVFNEIHWYGFEAGNSKSYLFRGPKSEKIIIKTLPKAVGGNSFLQKLLILPVAPLLIIRVFNLICRYQYIHTRGPSLPAWIAIVVGIMFKKKRFWHKYAGSWNHPSPPLAYSLQRKLLKRSRHPVTINGFWGDTNPLILSFENPCFSSAELREAMRQEKNFNVEQYHVIFVGRLEEAKGIFQVVQAALMLGERFNWYLVGEGKEYNNVLNRVAGSSNIHVVGALNREELNKLYSKSHFIVLPSASEGFPKVISEACGYGCIPVVSPVSSIIQYISNEFGFVLPNDSSEAIIQAFEWLQTDSELEKKSALARSFASAFTYERYVDRIRTEVFKLPQA